MAGKRVTIWLPEDVVSIIAAEQSAKSELNVSKTICDLIRRHSRYEVRVISRLIDKETGAEVEL